MFSGSVKKSETLPYMNGGGHSSTVSISFHRPSTHFMAMRAVLICVPDRLDLAWLAGTVGFEKHRPSQLGEPSN